MFQFLHVSHLSTDYRALSFPHFFVRTQNIEIMSNI